MERIKTSIGDLPVNFGMNSLALYSDMRDVKISSVFELDYTTLNLMDFFALLYSGILDGARKAGEECKLKTLEDFNDFVEDEPDFLTNLKGIFSAQQGGDKEAKGEEGKKK